MFEILLHLDLTSLLIIVIFFLFLEYRPPWWYRSNDLRKKDQVIPGPKSLPGIGTTWIFYLGRYKFNRLHEFYRDIYEKYGPIVKEESWGNVPVIHIFEKTDIVKVMKSNSKYPLRPPIEAAAVYRKSRPDRYASTGLLNEQGPAWQHLRSALTPTFTSPKTISEFLPQVREICDDFCHFLRNQRDSEDRVKDMGDVCERLGLEISCALVLGRRMGFLMQGGEAEAGRKLAAAVCQHFQSIRDTYFGFPFWKFLPTESYRKLYQSEETIYDLASQLISSAEESTKDSIIFQAVLKAEVDEREKIAAIIDFISAGIYTTKNTLLYLLHLVGGKPEIQENIRTDKAYSKACLQETFRVLPVAPTLARIIDEDMELSGFKIPAGTTVVCHTATACCDNRNFEKAQEFLPERWLDERKSQTTNSALFVLTPFGIGKRICPGKRFIEQILPTILDCLVDRFELSAKKELELEFEFLLVPKGKVPMVLKDRN